MEPREAERADLRKRPPERLAEPLSGRATEEKMPALEALQPRQRFRSRSQDFDAEPVGGTRHGPLARRSGRKDALLPLSSNLDLHQVAVRRILKLATVGRFLREKSFEILRGRGA